MSSAKPPSKNQPRDMLSVELGGWFKAHATGGGVIAVPLVILLVLAVGLARLWLR